MGALSQALVLELLVGDPLLDDGLVGSLGLCESLLSRAEGRSCACEAKKGQEA